MTIKEKLIMRPEIFELIQSDNKTLIEYAHKNNFHRNRSIIANFWKAIKQLKSNGLTEQEINEVQKKYQREREKEQIKHQKHISQIF